MHPVIINLTLPEFFQAVGSAMLRIVMSAAWRLNHSTTYTRPMLKRLEEETVGVCGEMAVGKFLNKWFVPSVNTFHRVPDLLGDTEVRATALADGCLIVRDNDSDDRRFILAVLDNMDVHLAGWMVGLEAKQDKWKRDPHSQRPAWFVPQADLHPMEEFYAT